MNLKKYILAFTYLLLSVGIMAQQPNQTIRGIVVDKASGHALPYVSIGLLNKPEIGVITDSLGQFRLNSVPVGRHNIQATSVGYEPYIVREILVTSAKEVYLEIGLKENIHELGEVVVHTQTSSDQALNKMALTGARMLTVEQTSRFAGGMDDPARLVSSFAGVASNVANNGISIHGNAPHLLQWRLEDIEIPNPNHLADLSTLGGGLLSSLSSNVLGNSDFFTGAFPSEYNNALSGVFDMRLRNGNNQKVENTVQVGILGLDVASEGPISRKHNSSYIVNYRYSTLAILNLGTDFNYQDLNFKLNFPTKKTGIFTLWGTGLIDNAKNIPDDPSKWETNDDRQKSVAKQYSGSTGFSHRYFFNNDAFLKTTLAVTYSNDNLKEDFVNSNMDMTPFRYLNNSSANVVLNTFYNRKFSSKHTNKTGITYTKMFYNMDMDMAAYENQPMETIFRGKGNSDLITAYTSSAIGLNDNISLTLGVNGQLLTLNNHWTLEPRAGIKWQTSRRTSFALAYGLHSRMEKLNVFFVKDRNTNELVNKNLDFTKAHHLMFSYNYRISENVNLKIEPYFQYLFDVPVIDGNSFSVLNRRDFYVEDPLVNKGNGRNVGVDITLERYLDKGFYYMITGSFFDSKYRGGDNIWRDSRFNRNYIVNALAGKEWMLGKNKQNILSVNLKFTYQGGDRYSPIDMEATMNHPTKDVQYDETKAFSLQYPAMFMTNASISYKINKKRVSHSFAFQAINLSGTKEFYGHAYNFVTGEIESLYNSTAIPNISYKLNF